METRNTRHIYRNDLGSAFFQHRMAYFRYKDWVKRTGSDKVIKEKPLKLQVIYNMMAMKEN